MNSSANYRVLVLRAVFLLAAAGGAVLSAGCESRVVGARGPGAGFYKVEESSLRDSSESVYGDSGVTKK